MAAHDNLSEHQFDRMYHASPARNRSGIATEGLKVEYDDGAGITAPGIYMSPRPPSGGTSEDVWEVDTSGIALEPDSPEQQREFSDVGGSYYSPTSIAKERLTLLGENDQTPPRT